MDLLFRGANLRRFARAWDRLRRFWRACSQLVQPMRADWLLFRRTQAKDWRRSRRACQCNRLTADKEPAYDLSDS
uniref:Uncharacterized protein n=1 Tax=uncultured bacterium A1Q1_fos_1070 TaxID=1256541 RepID=L7VWL2_9BACT|nr:hypothetical protein [uncultured bacterium A1Q1_fos_1070]